jgi:hypothetical protein
MYLIGVLVIKSLRAFKTAWRQKADGAELTRAEVVSQLGVGGSEAAREARLPRARAYSKPCGAGGRDLKSMQSATPGNNLPCGERVKPASVASKRLSHIAGSTESHPATALGCRASCGGSDVAGRIYSSMDRP